MSQPNTFHPKMVLSEDELGSLLSRYFVARFPNSNELIKIDRSFGEWVVHEGFGAGFIGMEEQWWRVSHGPSGLAVPGMALSQDTAIELASEMAKCAGAQNPTAGNPDSLSQDVREALVRWINSRDDWFLI